MIHLVHVPKTGGTALSTLPHVIRHEHHERLSDVPRPALIVLRDPVARFISAFEMYKAQRHLHGTIEEFVDDLEANVEQNWPGHGFRHQSWWYDQPGPDVVVLRTEWLDALFGALLPQRGDIDRNEARPSTIGLAPSWWEPSRLTPEHHDRVKRFYEADYRLLEALCQP